VLLLCLAAAGVQAEEGVAARAGPTAQDLLELRLRYGVAVRSGSQKDGGPSLSYSGVTPNDLALSAWAWFLAGGHVGAFLNLQREAFSLYANDSRVTGGGLVRASVGPSGRLWFGPVRLEAHVGYAFHQLPTWGYSGNPTFSAGTRHGLLLATRALFDLGPVTVEARGDFPVSLAATDGAGKAASSFGFEVGGSVRLQLLRTGPLMWGVLGDVSYSEDSLTGSTSGLNVHQSLIRGGGAIDLKWQEAAIEPPKLGSVEVTVTDEENGAPVVSATVEIGEKRLPVDAAGMARLGELSPGTIDARGTASGYLPLEGQATIEAGGKASLLLKLKKEPPKLGRLLIKVSNQQTKAALAKASVKVGDATLATDEHGVVRFGGLKPGPVGIAVTAEGYNPGEEAASVVGGQEAEVAVALVEVKKRIPATINGLVRSTSGGKPVTADLEIPQLKIKTRASPSGAFSFRLEGGTYTVNISAPGYLAQSKSVTVKDGDQAIFNVDLHPR
jgi:hypothetical protein